MAVEENASKLIEQIQAEQNPAKLTALIGELTRLLDAKRASTKDGSLDTSTRKAG
jgi:hypothetical protein